MRTLRIGFSSFLRLSNRLAACALFALLAMAPGVGAQVRFADVLHGPRRDMAAEKQALVDAISRGELKRVINSKPKQPTAIPDPNLIGLPHWTTSQKINGKDYPFTIIGGDPSAGQTTVIPVVIIPYRFTFDDGGGVIDASTDVVDGIDEVDGILGSPVFQDYPFTAGSSALGTTQLGDAYLRAAFWDRAGGSGSSYHTRLQVVAVLPALEVEVDPSAGFSLNVGGETIGVIDGGLLVDFAKSVVGAFGIPSPVLTIHAFGQTIGAGAVSFLGIHPWADVSAQTGVPGLSTMLFVGWFSDVINPGGANSAVLGHEMLEWLMDPIEGNAVPAWPKADQPNRCYNYILEVADPIEELPSLTFSLGGYDYSLPDAVFPTWFSGAKARGTVNGWYSLYNEVHTPAAACPFFEWPITFYFPNDVGMTEAHLTGLNNHKQVSGYYVQYGELVSFVLGNVDPLAQTTPITLDMIVSVPSAAVTVARRINDAGQVVGLYFDAAGNQHGFLFSGGHYATIDYPGALATEVLGINDQIVPTLVGDYVDASGAGHGFLLKAGVFTTIDVPGAFATAIWDVNNTNQLVGRFADATQVRGFTGTPGKLSVLDYLGSPLFATLASGINADGNVAGTWVDSAHFASGFLYGAGYFMSAHIDEANDLNATGNIAGSFFIHGALNAAIALPVPSSFFAPGASTTMALPEALLHRH